MGGGRAGGVRFPPGLCDELIVVSLVAPLQISFFRSRVALIVSRSILQCNSRCLLIVFFPSNLTWFTLYRGYRVNVAFTVLPVNRWPQRGNWNSVNMPALASWFGRNHVRYWTRRFNVNRFVVTYTILGS